MTTRSFWLEDTKKQYPSIHERAEADVAIVGGGLSGVATAYFLTRAGLRPIVLEAEELAFGASGRNAGFVLGGASMPFGELVSRAGFETAKQIYDASLKNQMLLEATLAAEGASAVGYRSEGSFYFAYSEDEERALRRTLSLLHRAGFSAESARPEDVEFKLRDTGARSGIYYPGDGCLNPVALVMALAEGAEQLGARFFEHAPVSEIRREGDIFSLKTQAGQVSAPSVIIAVGAWLGALWRGADFITPTRAQALATEPVSSGDLRPVYGDHGHRYFRRLSSGELLMGGFRNLDVSGEVGTELRLNDRIQDELERSVGQLSGARPTIRSRWAGIMAFTPDELPVVGKVADGVYVLGGYSGHGLGLALFAGDRVAKEYLGQSGVFAPFAPTRFMNKAKSR